MSMMIFETLQQLLVEVLNYNFARRMPEPQDTNELLDISYVLT